jgi:hypothetical protein
MTLGNMRANGVRTIAAIGASAIAERRRKMILRATGQSSVLNSAQTIEPPFKQTLTCLMAGDRVRQMLVSLSV